MPNTVQLVQKYCTVLVHLRYCGQQRLSASSALKTCSFSNFFHARNFIRFGLFNLSQLLGEQNLYDSFFGEEFSGCQLFL